MLGVAAATGVIWAGIGALLTAVVAIVAPGTVGQGEGPGVAAWVLGRAGVVAGLVAAGLLALAERRGEVARLSVGRAALWGGLGGVALPWIAVAPVAMLPMLALLGAASTAILVALAKRGDRLLTPDVRIPPLPVREGIRMRSSLLVPLSLLAADSLLPARAGAQNVDAMARWTAYEVVHYHVVGAYSGETTILMSKQGQWRAAPVQDHVEIDFDWNQQEMKLVGVPTITNFPSTVGPIPPVAGCPDAKVNGTYEMATVTAVTDRGGTILALTSVRAFPAGSIPSPAEMDPCGSSWDPVTASTVTAENMLQVLPAMMLAMPGAGAYAVTPDGKSMYVKGGNTGTNASGVNDWSWTYTPSPVR